MSRMKWETGFVENWIKGADPAEGLWREDRWSRLHDKVMSGIDQWEEKNAQPRGSLPQDENQIVAKQGSAKAPAKRSASARRRGLSMKQDCASKPARA